MNQTQKIKIKLLIEKLEKLSGKKVFIKESIMSTKKYFIQEYAMGGLNDAEIVCRDEEVDEDGDSMEASESMYDSFKLAKANLLYALKESAKELDENDEEYKQELIQAYNQLKPMDEKQYRLAYPENFK